MSQPDNARALPLAKARPLVKRPASPRSPPPQRTLPPNVQNQAGNGQQQQQQWQNQMRNHSKNKNNNSKNNPNASKNSLFASFRGLYNNNNSKKDESGRSRRVFDDMESDESDISDFEPVKETPAMKKHRSNHAKRQIRRKALKNKYYNGKNGNNNNYNNNGNNNYGYNSNYYNYNNNYNNNNNYNMYNTNYNGNISSNNNHNMKNYNRNYPQLGQATGGSVVSPTQHGHPSGRHTGIGIMNGANATGAAFGVSERSLKRQEELQNEMRMSAMKPGQKFQLVGQNTGYHNGYQNNGVMYGPHRPNSPRRGPNGNYVNFNNGQGQMRPVPIMMVQGRGLQQQPRPGSPRFQPTGVPPVRPVQSMQPIQSIQPMRPQPIVMGGIAGMGRGMGRGMPFRKSQLQGHQQYFGYQNYAPIGSTSPHSMNMNANMNGFNYNNLPSNPASVPNSEPNSRSSSRPSSPRAGVGGGTKVQRQSQAPETRQQAMSKISLTDSNVRAAMYDSKQIAPIIAPSVAPSVAPSNRSASGLKGVNLAQIHFENDRKTKENKKSKKNKKNNKDKKDKKEKIEGIGIAKTLVARHKNSVQMGSPPQQEQQEQVKDKAFLRMNSTSGTRTMIDQDIANALGGDNNGQDIIRSEPSPSATLTERDVDFAIQVIDNNENENENDDDQKISTPRGIMQGFPVSMNELQQQAQEREESNNLSRTISGISRAETVYYTHDTDKVKSPLYYNQNSKSDDIVVSKFKHSRPIAGTEYFQELWGIQDGLSVVVPFFNETATELEITLKSLYYSYQYLCFKLPIWERKPFNVCIIQDGWYKAHATMKRYLKKMFPKKIYNFEEKLDIEEEAKTPTTAGSPGSPGSSAMAAAIAGSSMNSNGSGSGSASTTSLFTDGKFWWKYYDEFTKYDESKQGSTTFIIEKTLDNPTYFQIRFKKPTSSSSDEKDLDYKQPKYQLKMNITLIIKIDNRRKHNSHEWFMGKDGFADASHAKYFLATDAFTIFDLKCLYYLVNYLEKNPKCCACTGRQRAMSRRQQGLRGREWMLSMDYILRMTQRCDFELSTCVYNPAFSIFGFLPVIPGPCGMYRCEDALQDDARNWYFDVINATPNETGLILGNLKIAEDRVLSYASILKLKHTRFMGFVDEAMFYFEAETNLDSFLYQRRRWINGTFAGYWYLLIKHPKIFWNWNASIFRKICVYFLLLVCLFQMIAIAISPAISFTILQQGVSFLLKKITYETNYNNDSVDSIVPVIMGVVWTMWVAHVIVHNQKKFHPIIMQFLYFLSALTSLSFAASYFILFFIENKTIYEALLVPGMSKELLDIVLILMGVAAICPILTNFLISADLDGVSVLLRSFFAYFLSFHMMIPWFSSYSFARCWDLSWGNRPASSDHDSHDGRRKASSMGSEMDLDLIDEKVDVVDLMKARFLQYSRLVTFGLIVFNFGVYFMPQYWKALLMSGILITGVLFMVLSVVILAIKFPYKVYDRYIKPICCKKRMHRQLVMQRGQASDNQQYYD